MKNKTRTSPTCCLHTFSYQTSFGRGSGSHPTPSHLPAGVRHTSQICSPSNRKRPAQRTKTTPDQEKAPERAIQESSLVQVRHTTQQRNASIGEGKWLPLGSNGVRSLEIQHCLAALLVLWVLRRSGAPRMIRKIGKSALQPAEEPPHHSHPRPLPPLSAIKSRVLPIGLFCPDISRGCFDCGHSVLFLM
jgi:hypothetical protein